MFGQKYYVLYLVNQIYLSMKMCGFLTYTIVPNIYLKFSSNENFQHIIGLGSCENFELYTIVQYLFKVFLRWKFLNFLWSA